MSIQTQDQTHRLVLNAQIDGQGKRFKAQLFKDGLISYKDENKGVSLIRYQTIKRCAPTFIGAPVTLRHENVENAQRGKIAEENGHIDNVYFNAEDGWFWCEGPANGASTKSRIKSVGKVSCGYKIPRGGMGPGGVYNCIPYDNEILDFVGNHLAIEPLPRQGNRNQGESRIVLNAQKPNQVSPMPNIFKWFKKDKQSAGADDAAAIAAKAKADAEAAEAARLNAQTAEDVGGDTLFEVPGSNDRVPLSDIMAGYVAHRDNAQNANEGALPEDASVEVPGFGAVPLSELVASHAKLNAQAAKPKVFRLAAARNNAIAAGATTAPAVLDTRETRLAEGKRLY